MRLASGRRKRWIRSCTSAALRPTPRRKTRFPFLPVRQIEGDLHAPHGSSPAPTLPERRTRFSAAGSDRLPFRPMNSLRSPVSVRGGIVHIEESDAPGNSVL
jgi:hypothetical protein